MKKYYLLKENSKLYWEYWKNDNSYMVHFGTLGTEGNTKKIKSGFFKNAKSTIEKEEKEIIDKGYINFDDLPQFRLLIEYTVEGMGNKSDIERRYRLEDKMNETLGWTGLGHCDGGSIGSGTMEVCCFVIDFNLAKEVVERYLKNTEFSNYTKIYDEDAD